MIVPGEIRQQNIENIIVDRHMVHKYYSDCQYRRLRQCRGWSIMSHSEGGKSMQAAAPTRSARKPAIRWGRIVVAAFLAEVAVILVIGAVILARRFFIAPGQSADEYRAFGEVAGYYAGPAGRAIMTFIFVLWAARKQNADFVLHGVLIGVGGVLLTAGFILVAKPEHRLMYLISYVLRIAAGYAGGVTARTRFGGVRSAAGFTA